MPSDTASPPRYPSDVVERIAKLEQIAEHTASAIADLRAEMREYRTDMRDMRREMNAQFRWLIGLYIAGFGSLLGIMAHGFKWL